MAKAAKRKRVTERLRYDKLHRFFTGLTVACLIVTFIGSTIAGSSVMAITWRCSEVFLILWLIEYIIIKTWASSEEIRESTARETISG